MRRRAEVLAEQVEIVRGLWSGEAFRFQGRHYRLETAETLPTPVQDPMPLIMGGSAGPRSAALAARFATEYNSPFPSLDQVRERREKLQAACEKAGRDPATLPYSAMLGVAIGGDEAEAEARADRIEQRTGNSGGPGWIVGGPEQAAATLRQYAEAGLSRVMLQLLLHEETDQIELIGKVLAPQLR